jgi:3-oxoacyl-(acyl-carrier-protein) synthase
LSTTIATGFNAGLDALVYTNDYVRSGYLDAVLVGGLEEVSYYGLVGLSRSGVLSRSDRMRPFAADADGYLAGEGCAVALLETEETARRRGAEPVARIAGAATTFDCTQAAGGYNSEGEGALAAVRQACEQAGIAPSDIDLVVASANGDPRGDAMEALVIRTLLGDTPVAVYKAKTGECYGASPLLSLACALAEVRTGRLSGTGGSYDTLEGVNVVKTETKTSAQHILLNSFSCDGNCGCLVLRTGS